MSGRSLSESKSHPYRVEGGFYIGDDVEVVTKQDGTRMGRVSGERHPFVLVRLDNGADYLAGVEDLTRIKR